MSTPVVMPQMGESIAEGTIVRWIKKVGDSVDRDEPLFEISTDKVDAEIPSPAAGVLLEIAVKEGETVPVNSVVATIGAAGEKAAAPPPPTRPPRAAPGAKTAHARGRRRPARDGADRDAAGPGRAAGRGRAAAEALMPTTAARSARRRWCAGSPRSTASTSAASAAPAPAAASPSTTSSSTSRSGAALPPPAVAAAVRFGAVGAPAPPRPRSSRASGSRSSRCR